MTKLNWPRNSDHILVCEHDRPLHGECLQCEMQAQYLETNRAMLCAAIVVVVLILGMVYFGVNT